MLRIQVVQKCGEGLMSHCGIKVVRQVRKVQRHETETGLKRSWIGRSQRRSESHKSPRDIQYYISADVFCLYTDLNDSETSTIFLPPSKTRDLPVVCSPNYLCVDKAELIGLYLTPLHTDRSERPIMKLSRL